MAASRAGSEAEVINQMHKRLDRMTEQLKNMGNRHKIADLQQFRYESIYSSGGELRLEHQKSIRDKFYGTFNSASLSNKKTLLNRAKNLAKTKPGYNNIPVADRKRIYWCKDNGSPQQWTAHLIDENSKNPDGTPALDHIREVSTHWNEEGHNQTQAQRQAWFNDITNHQVICTNHNSKKGGQNYKFNVGPNFRGPNE
jgi:hypothetical protein